jgi:hypothetical protein
LRDINYAARLWQVFRAIISGPLNELKELLGDAVTLVIETIEKHINCFFVQALQLDPKTLSPSSSFNSFNGPLMIALKTCQRRAA